LRHIADIDIIRHYYHFRFQTLLPPCWLLAIDYAIAIADFAAATPPLYFSPWLRHAIDFVSQIILLIIFFFFAADADFSPRYCCSCRHLTPHSATATPGQP